MLNSLLALLVTGFCNTPCTEMACVSGVSINYSSKNKGRYQFLFQIDDKKVSCRGSLPFISCDSSFKCTSDLVVITESGCALKKSQHSIEGIQLNATPEKLSVEVKLNGRSLGVKKINPKYSVAQPNGGKCEPSCKQAIVDYP